MSVRVMIAIWLGCVLAGAGSSSGVLAGDAFGDRSVRSPTICPSGIFVDPATLPRTDIPTQPGSIQTQWGEVYEIFNRQNVREAIETCLRNRTGITKPWIVDKLAAIIDTSLADIGSWDTDGTFVLPPSDDLTDEQKVTVSEVVTEYGKNGRTTKVKLHDKLAAMAQLSKLLNMLVDRH